jgi:hypothetical protein
MNIIHISEFKVNYFTKSRHFFEKLTIIEEKIIKC